ncbi:unnamed protein product [Phytomonas sp. EM1]|nr:unnamed protein product [Phytomonas sp. EM1]|eukprot:CCW63304.1 unnamed protein product [Phytomonas sp. isolate EM1]
MLQDDCQKNCKVNSEVFEYVFNAVPFKGDTAAYNRQLGIAHFEFLAEKIDLGLADLSFYILAFYLKCSSALPYHISEACFVSGLSQALSPDDKVSPENEYAGAFRALRSAVRKTHHQILHNEVDLIKFYNFLYMWCLRNNRASDRTTVAMELWELFFTEDSSSMECDNYKHYVCFRNLRNWIAFVGTNSFAENFSISADLWHQLFYFAKLESYETYSTSDSWPLALDSFVEWSKQGQSEENNMERY